MAETAQKNLHTEIAVGITGTTGNVDPNNADSMQGKVFFCILVGENAYDYEYNAEVTQMSRHEIKELYADKVFEYVTYPPGKTADAPSVSVIMDAISPEVQLSIVEIVVFVSISFLTILSFSCWFILFLSP